MRQVFWRRVAAWIGVFLMSEAASSMAKLPERLNGWRDRFATSLGLSPQRKEEIYLDLSKSATLRDPSYWLQILFAASIATLGLALNSPAVIIGAMLISPLMGPILAGGLAFASGDLILGLRASLSLLPSCLAAADFQHHRIEDRDGGRVVDEGRQPADH
jgi:hypothetical protein